MSLRQYPDIKNFPSSQAQIELIESMEYIQGPQLSIEELLQIRSVNSFVKKYFESQNCKYTQILSASNNLITCKVYVNEELVSEVTRETFNEARVKAAILTMQEYNLDLLKEWLSMHKEDVQQYLTIT